MPFAENLLDEAPAARLDMTAFVDIIFNLLLFFLLSSTYVQHTALEIDLPKARAAGAVEGRPVIVALTADDRIFLDETPVPSLEALSSGLASAKAEGREVLMVSADRRAQHGNVVEILDVAKRIGFTDLRVASRPAPSREGGSEE